MVPSGNVSLYNGGLGAGIPPTPVLMATGIVPDLRHAMTSDLKVETAIRSTSSGPAARARRIALGAPARAQRPPGSADDPDLTRRLGERLLAPRSEGHLAAVHDVSDGGLAVTLAEMAFGGGFGFTVDLSVTRLDAAAQALAVEGSSRWVVEVPPSEGRRSNAPSRGSRSRGSAK